MGTDKPDKYFALSVLDQDYEAIVIPFYIENNPIVHNDTYTSVDSFDISRSLPD